MDARPRSVNPRRTPQQSRSEALVDALVEATIRVVGQEGGKGATTKRIAEVAGVSIGSLYQYFPNKDALLHAVTLRHQDDLLHRLALISLAPDRRLRDCIAEFVGCMVQAHAIDAKVHRAISEQMLRRGPGAYADAQNRALALVEGVVRARPREVTVRNPAMAAWLLVNTAEGTVHTALMDDDGRLLQPAFASELLELLCGYLHI